MSEEQSKVFGSRLARVRRRWQAGLLLRALFRLTGLAALVLLGYVLLDFFLAFGTRARFVLNALAGIFLVGTFLVSLVHVLKITDRDAARRADRLLAVPRKPVLSAFELDRWMRARPAAAGFGTFLIGQTITRADGELGSLRLRDHFPLREIWGQFRLLMVQLLVVGLLLAAHTTASHTIIRRILHPTRDIPPYSRYTFTVSPESPLILYGGNAELAVTVGGAPVRSQVWFITRHGANRHRAACFQQSGTVFAQRLEKVVSPVEFCFAVGRARSKWHRVNLLLQPQIAMAEAHIAPPAYSRRPPRRFFVGNEEFAALPRSEARLVITSNRPLLDGVLTVRPALGIEADRTVTGRRTARNTVEFTWTMDTPAILEATIRDLRGTRNRDPLRIRQKTVPDAPPEAHITHPDHFALATPAATLPLSGYVTDDLGLRRVELVRTVVGYRDRIKPLGPETHTCNFEFDNTLDLKALGTEPGQVLEFYIEAGDLNPSLMGIGASDVARVQIISEQEYAAMLRDKATLEQFMERYNQAAAHLQRLKDALQKARDAASSDPKAAEAALAEARAAAEAAAAFFRNLGSDFPIYDMEQRLSKVAEKMARAMDKIWQLLKDTQASNPRLPGIMSGLLSALAQPDDELQKEITNARELEKVARVMQCAGRFREIVRRQRELVRRLDRFREEGGVDTKLLASLGRRQDELRRALELLAADLLERAGKLPDTYRNLRSSAKQFAELIHENQIPGLMGKGATAARNQDGRRARSFATLALEALEKLMSDCKGECFGGMCQGDMPFSVPKDMASTMAQMLAALLGQSGRPGSGSDSQGVGGIGTGAGFGGSADDGFWMGGYSPINMPIFGPSRMMFRSTSQPGVRATSGSGRGTGTGRVAPEDTEKMDVKHKGDLRSRSMPLENVPEKYREAIKRYFGGD